MPSKSNGNNSEESAALAPIYARYRTLFFFVVFCLIYFLFGHKKIHVYFLWIALHACCAKRLVFNTSLLQWLFFFLCQLLCRWHVKSASICIFHTSSNLFFISLSSNDSYMSGLIFFFSFVIVYVYCSFRWIGNSFYTF